MAVFNYSGAAVTEEPSSCVTLSKLSNIKKNSQQLIIKVETIRNWVAQ